MKRQSLSDTQYEILCSISSVDGLLNVPAIKVAASKVYISLREAEKFNTRTKIMKLIGEGKIRLKSDIDNSRRTRQNASYKCLLWDVLRQAIIK